MNENAGEQRRPEPISSAPGWQNSIWRLPVLSGLLLVFAYFPFGLLIPNFVAFLPILYWLDCNPDASVRRRMRAGLAFGLTTNIILLHWMYAMLAISWMAITLYVFVVSVFALCAMVAVALMGWIRARTRGSFALVLQSAPESAPGMSPVMRKSLRGFEPGGCPPVTPTWAP